MSSKTGKTIPTQEPLVWTVASTTLGQIVLAASLKGVRYLGFCEHADDAGEQVRSHCPDTELLNIDAMDDAQAAARFNALLRDAVEAVETPAAGSVRIPLDIRGTDFQQRVWQALRDIPAGETRSYGELATVLGDPKSSRAVGGANGANKIAVLIPCHRVVQSDGSLGGYAYGLAIKRALLEREGALQPELFN